MNADKQQAAVAKLVARGWRVDREAGADGVVYLSRRDRKLRSMTHYVEVDADGALGGDVDEAGK